MEHFLEQLNKRIEKERGFMVIKFRFDAEYSNAAFIKEINRNVFMSRRQLN